MIDLQEPGSRSAARSARRRCVWTSADEAVAAARDWAGPGGPPVVIDATGVPAAVRAMVDMVASAGRAVQVGMSGDEVPLRIGSLTEKEIDMLGVSCCDGDEFAEAVAVVERNGDCMAAPDQPRVLARRAPEAIGSPSATRRR